MGIGGNAFVREIVTPKPHPVLAAGTRAEMPAQLVMGIEIENHEAAAVKEHEQREHARARRPIKTRGNPARIRVELEVDRRYAGRRPTRLRELTFQHALAHDL